MVKSISVAQQPPAWGASAEIEDRYRPMVAELENLAARHPAQYRGRVFRRALLGYGYIALVIAAILILVAGIVLFMVFGHFTLLVAKPLFFLFIGVFYILRALWVKIPAPEGQRVSPQEAPALFAMLADVRRHVKGPKIETVLVTGDFNALIVQIPRFGIFGGYRNILILGLPLLTALPRDEVMAVIAHEYGHLAGAHGKMSAWIYRVRMTWLQLSQSLGKGWLSRIFQKFFNWYGPWFSAYSFVLARDNEYEADRASADLAGVGVTARALMRVAVEAQRHDGFWNTLFERSGNEAQVFPHAAMASYFVQPVAPAVTEGALKAALTDKTDIHDTHPCLADRLKALDIPLPDLPPVGISGAMALLGGELSAHLAAQLDAGWWNKVGGFWTERREEAAAQHVELAELEAKAADGGLTEEETWTYQSLLESCGAADRALEVARQRYADEPSEMARLVYGRLLLQADNAEGLVVLGQVMDDMDFGQPRLVALDHCLDYLRRTHADDPRIAVWQAEFDKALVHYRAMQAELEHLDENCRLETVVLDEETVSAIRNRAAHATDIRTIWVAQRSLRSEPRAGQYVLLFDAGTRDENEYQGFVQDILEILRQHENTFVIRHARANDWLKRRMEKIEGAQILKR